MIRILQNITYTKYNKQSKNSQEYNIKINTINTPNYLTLKHPIKVALQQLTLPNIGVSFTRNKNCFLGEKFKKKVTHKEVGFCGKRY